MCRAVVVQGLALVVRTAPRRDAVAAVRLAAVARAAITARLDNVLVVAAVVHHAVAVRKMGPMLRVAAAPRPPRRLAQPARSSFHRHCW